WRRRTSKSIELRVARIALRAMAQDRLSQERLAPERHEPARVEISGMETPEPHRRRAGPRLVGRLPLEDGAQHRMRRVGARCGVPARVLDPARAFLARGIDVDRDVHERARPAVDERTVTRLRTLALEDRPPLRICALPRARAQAKPEHRDPRPHLARA